MGWQLSKVSGCRDSCLSARALALLALRVAGPRAGGICWSHCRNWHLSLLTHLFKYRRVKVPAFIIVFQPLYRSCCSLKAPALPVQRLCNNIIGYPQFRTPAPWGCSIARKLRDPLSHSLHKERPIVLAVSEFNRSVILDPSLPQPPATEKAMAQEEWVSLNVSASELQLCFTLPTGQSFRWRETAACEYTGVIGSRVVSGAPDWCTS